MNTIERNVLSCDDNFVILIKRDRISQQVESIWQTRRHGGAYRGRAPQMTACAPQMTACAPQATACAPQARTMPQGN